MKTFLKDEKHSIYDFAKMRDNCIIFIKWNDQNIFIIFGSRVCEIAPTNLVNYYLQTETKFMYIDQPTPTS